MNLRLLALILSGSLAQQGAMAAEKLLTPEEKCTQHLEGLAKSISGQLESFLFFGKSPPKTTTIKKPSPTATSETSESMVKVTVGNDVYEFTVKDLYECRVDKLAVTRGDY